MGRGWHKEENEWVISLVLVTITHPLWSRGSVIAGIATWNISILSYLSLFFSSTGIVVDAEEEFISGSFHDLPSFLAKTNK